MEKMKERIVAFGDAIIAIIITIIVLELPIKLSSSGEVDMYILFRSIGIYFISFCFVADLWYQGAQKFNQIKKIKNKDFVIYMLFLFALSLVPTFTRLLIEDTNRQVVFFYGILSFIVTFLWTRLIYSLGKQIEEKDKTPEFFRKRENKRQMILLGFRLVVLVIAYFLPKWGLVVYLVLPIIGFMQNIIDKEEDRYVSQMNEEQKDYYVGDLKRERGSNVRKYMELLRSSLGDDSKSAADRQQWWLNFNNQWQKELEKQTTAVDEKISSATSQSEKQHFEREKQRLMMEQQKIQQIMKRTGERLNHPRGRR
ncbi:TMEM175 family protein [uncultured Enterococcus sp.]|uniref:TMEM175 family protein n=1 Tax=uncultured Enterococcus sp. TaxID=167972 RepID=UPI002AA6A66D|nr:TMEM175 family protein [uncultured Enterococcus sp.]